MDWYLTESDVMPLEEDTTTDKYYNYITRNVREEERTDEQGNTTTWYVYEECKIPKESWGLYQTQEQQSADIDYLLMITEDL